MKVTSSLNNIVSALASVAKVLLLSRRPFKRLTQADSSELVILGNGPSLRALLDNQLSTLQTRRLLCVNFAANAPEFVLLKPAYYVLADPHFFNGIDSDPNVKRLWENIGKEDWNMTLFVPHKFIKKALTLLPSGNVQPFNLTPAEGCRALVHPLYNAGLAMPRPRNVLIPSIMIGIRLGFKKIWLCGADHTWSRTLSVDEENRVISVQPHFYKDSKTEQKRVNTEYEGYRLHDILRSLYIAFRAYHDIAAFAAGKGVTIYNATPGSMIDAFPGGSCESEQIALIKRYISKIQALMKRSLRILTIGLLAGTAFTARAQYYDMANQLVSMVQPALSGGLNYRGFLDAGYTTGVGRNGCSSLEISTTQGFKYGSWFFMGVGAGVNIVFAGQGDQSDYDFAPRSWGNGYNPNYKTRDTGVVIPLYSDFRFNIGGEQNTSFFIDLRLGAAFLVGKNYLLTPDGVLDNSEGFYFRPTLGVRIPVNGKDSRQAINVGVSYQLITNNYWDYGGYYNNTSVNSVGATIGFEW